MRRTWRRSPRTHIHPRGKVQNPSIASNIQIDLLYLMYYPAPIDTMVIPREISVEGRKPLWCIAGYPATAHLATADRRLPPLFGVLWRLRLPGGPMGMTTEMRRRKRTRTT
jgi:hypothetical protein